MEAVPRLPMVSFQLKVSPEPTTFGPKLLQYIREFYNEDPESYTCEINQLENLRAMVVRPPLDMAGCLLLKKYYCQLHFLQSRFPMGKDGAAAVTFTWRDTYANMVCSLASIRFEMISILYNIGAMHTQLGARTERTSADGMKMACAHFQCAAWAFEHLKNSYPQPSGIDMAPELMTFMHQLCLAQAQECILEKSMLDNRKPTIVAKVARQIVDYYTQAWCTLQQGGSEDGTISDTVGTKIYKTWKRYVKFKLAYHWAVTQLYQGLGAEEQRKMGERVAFYNAASASLEKAHSIYNNAKGSKGITGPLEEKKAVEEALVFTNDVIEGKRKAAKNENEFIYHEEVPEIEALPTVKGASLVKGIHFNINDSEISGPDIFARLVPMKVHEASSLYSEEKAKVLRSVVVKIEEKDQQLNSFLAYLKLEHMSLWDPDVQATDWERLPLPDDLVERCAALNAKQHVIQELADIISKLTEMSEDVEKILKEIEKLLTDEELKEKQYQGAVGKRPPSIVATDLTREAKKYEEAHNKASESNHTLRKAITMHVKNLKILAQPLADLMAHIPSPSANLSEQNTDKSQSAIELDRMHTKELKRILNKVDEMRRQRSELLTKLRESIAQDDLTRLLVTATSDSGPLDRLFAEQLSKHQPLVNLLEQNLTAQEIILSALTNAYAQTANVRKNVEETLKRRELVISSLIASYDAYEDLTAKANKGLEFYRKLEINVSKLLQRVKSTCKVQDEEREQILAQDKTTQDKVDTPATPTYDLTRNRTGSGLKLKDYLNNRVDNMYKNHSRSIQIDAAAKSFTADTGEKNHAQASGSVPGVDMGSAMPNPQHYYPTSYPDYAANPGYSYGVHGYGESTNNTSAYNQNYMQPSTSEIPSSYQQAPTSGTTATMTNSCMQYPANTYVSNGQMYPITMSAQDRYMPSQSQYGLPSTTVPYNSYQSTVDYAGYNNPGSQYPVAMEKTGAIPKTDMHEIPQQMPPTNPPSNVVDASSQIYNPPQQYLPEAQQQIHPQDVSAINKQEPLPQTTQVHNYPLAQANQMEHASSQSYASNQYYNTAEIHSQQQGIPSQSVAGAASNISSQYIPSQYMGAQQSTGSVNVSNNDAATSYTTNIQTPQVMQYHPGTADQSKQNYMENAYGGYGSQIPANNASLNYSTTYQTVQGSPAVSYQTSNYQTDASGTYSYMPAPTTQELIQSHAKASSIQNYSQNYPYTQQNDYRGYPVYNYPQEAQATNTMSDPYAGQPGYTYSTAGQTQPYQYNPGNVQTTQGQQPSVNSSESQANMTTSDMYYQPGNNNNSTYTNACSNASVSQTQSSHYSTQTYTSPTTSDMYYTTPYGLQMQGQGPTSKTETYTKYNQTFMQAANNDTSTTASANPTKSASKSSEEEKSNVDLLSDLDVTINHAPLVPEVKPLNKPQSEETPSTVDEEKVEKVEEESDNEKNKSSAASSLGEDRTEMENLQIVWDTWYNDVQPKKDPLGEPAALQKLITEAEKYEKFVDSLLIKTLSGATNLDIKWKEVQDSEARESSKQSCTVALAHSSENRVMECIPYDTTRVQISSSDVPNYINASHIVEITQWIPTAFIITQTPLPDKQEVFWTMIWEQETEVIACLASDAQLNGEIYWPVSEENILRVGNFTISLKKRVNQVSYVQRIISICHTKKKCEKTVVHMQFLAWPSNGFPNSPGALLCFSTDVMSEQALRRCSPKPVVVHCLDGGSLSSLFLVAAATVCHIRAGCGIVDVPLVFKGLAKCRKQVVNKESMLFAYRMVLYHAQDSLMKRGILSSSRSTFENFDGLKGNRDKLSGKMHHPSDDFLRSLGVGAQRSDAEKQGKKLSGSGGSATPTSLQEKSSEKAIDPLSQLDPLWSIRR